MVYRLPNKQDNMSHECVLGINAGSITIAAPAMTQPRIMRQCITDGAPELQRKELHDKRAARTYLYIALLTQN